MMGYVNNINKICRTIQAYFLNIVYTRGEYMENVGRIQTW